MGRTPFLLFRLCNQTAIVDLNRQAFHYDTLIIPSLFSHFLFRLALYVYEYLRHVGAPKAAQTFLSEIRWEKNITLGEAPGFLHAWWSVFWDLYCAAPERRDSCDHSSEAKAFHDLVSLRILLIYLFFIFLLMHYSVIGLDTTVVTIIKLSF